MSQNRPARALGCALFLMLPALLAAGAAEALPAVPPGAFRPLSAPDRDATQFDIAVAEDGSAVAAWVETNYTTFQLWAAFYTPADGWGAAAMLDNQSNDLYAVRLGLDSFGKATLVWILYTSPTVVWYAQAPAGGPFAAPVLLHNVSVVLQGLPHLAVSAMGRAFISWVEGSPDGQVLVAVVEPGASSADVFNLTEAGTSAISSTVATDASGVGTAVWCAWNGSAANLTFARFGSGLAWTPAATAIPDVSTGCGQMVSAPSPTGGVTVLLDRQAAGGSEVAAAEFSPTSGWSGLVRVFNATATSYRAQLRLSAGPDGAMAAGWVEATFPFPFPTSMAWVAWFDPVEGWQTPVAIGSSSSSSLPMDIAAGPGGFGLAAAAYPGGTSTGVQLRQHTRQADCDAWSDAGIAPGSQTSTPSVAVALDESGRGFVAWDAHTGSGWQLGVAPVQILEPPRASITAPADGALVESAIVQITGTAPPGSIARAGGSFVTADTTGNFSVLVPVRAGENQIQVKVTLGGGWEPCADEFEVRVTFDDPVPVLRAELANATANLTILQAAVTDAYTQIQDLEASGTASQAEINALRDDLNDAQVALDLAEAQVTSLSLAINASGEVNAANLQTIASLQTQIDLLQQRLNTTANQTAANSADRAALDGARASASFGLLLGAVGAILGAAGVALAITSRRGKPDHSKASDASAGKGAEDKASDREGRPDHTKASDSSAGGGSTRDKD